MFSGQWRKPTELIMLISLTEIVNISPKKIGVLSFWYTTPFEDGVPCSGVAMQFTERVYLVKPLL